MPVDDGRVRLVARAKFNGAVLGETEPVAVFDVDRANAAMTWLVGQGIAFDKRIVRAHLALPSTWKRAA